MFALDILTFYCIHFWVGDGCILEGYWKYLFTERCTQSLNIIAIRGAKMFVFI